MKKLHVLTIAAVLTFSLVSCSGSSGTSSDPSGQSTTQEELDIFVIQQTSGEGMQAFADAFMKENPGVKVNVEVVMNDHATVLKSRDATGNLPDIFATGSPGEHALEPYITSGKIADVSNFKVVQQLPEETKSSMTFSDQKIYNIPLTTGARGIIYNKDIFEEVGVSVPTTYTEFVDVCEKISAAGYTPFAMGATDGWTIGSQVVTPVFEHDASIEWNKAMFEGTESFDPCARGVFKVIDLIKEYDNQDSNDIDYLTAAAYLLSGECSMGFYDVNMYPVLQEIDPEATERLGMFPVPYSEDASENKFLIFNDYYQVNSSSNLELVDQFFDFIINSDTGKEIYKNIVKQNNIYGIPFDANCLQQDVIDSLDSVGYYEDYQNVNQPDGFWQIWSSVTQEYFADIISVDEALQKLDDSWKSIQSGTN